MSPNLPSKLADPSKAARPVKQKLETEVLSDDTHYGLKRDPNMTEEA